MLANDTDVDAGPKTIQLGDPAGPRDRGHHRRRHGLTYAPNANYCNTALPTDTSPTPSHGRSVGDVAVTVTCSDDPPVAVDDSPTVAEDSGATAVAVLANDTDGGDGGPKTVQSVTSRPTAPS